MSAVIKKLCEIAGESEVLTFSTIRRKNPALFFYVKEHKEELIEPLLREGYILFNDKARVSTELDMVGHIKTFWDNYMNLSDLKKESIYWYRRVMGFMGDLTTEEWCKKYNIDYEYSRTLTDYKAKNLFKEFVSDYDKMLHTLPEPVYARFKRPAKSKGMTVGEYVNHLGFNYVPYEEIEDEIFELREAGMKFKTIAEMYNAPIKTIHAIYYRLRNERRDNNA